VGIQWRAAAAFSKGRNDTGSEQSRWGRGRKGGGRSDTQPYGIMKDAGKIGLVEDDDLLQCVESSVISE
jgi:hypothetical protein